MSRLDRMRAKQQSLGLQPKPEPPPDPAPLPAPRKPPRKRPPSPAERDKRELGRYPDGTLILFQYDGKAELWTGALTIPGLSDVLTLQATGMHHLASRLWDLYQCWLKAKEGA